MILVKPSFEILEIMGESYGEPIRLIEKAGRTCYKTEDNITSNSAEKFVKMIMDGGHESVIEHSAITVKIICDGGVTHEIVRHRLVAYSQESTKYCNYKGGVTFVIPPWLNRWIGPGEYKDSREEKCERPNNVAASIWFHHMMDCEYQYMTLVVNENWSPQQARSVLPNSLKTEIVMTANFREWRHILKLRTSKAAHPQMREVMVPILKEFQSRIPILFDNIQCEVKV